jgi:hypothetical protein
MIAAAVALLLCASAATSVAAPAAGTGGPVTRYAPVLGNAHYLVYAEAIRAKPLDPQSFSSRVELYMLRKTGGPVALGPLGLSPWYFSLTGSNLIAVHGNVNGKSHVKHWNLATGHHAADVTSENVIGASPDGWLFEVRKPDGTHVMSQSYSGTLTDYGDPLVPGVDFAVTSGPNGFLAYANNFENENGQFTYTSWSHPARHRTLLTAKHQNNFCASVSAAYAACMLGAVKHPLVLLPLDGRKPTIKAGTCASAFTMWGTSIGLLVGGHGSPSCPRGTVARLSRGGRLTYSKRRYSTVTVTSAWGRLIASSKAQHGLVTLTGPRATPRPLGRATVSPPVQ